MDRPIWKDPTEWIKHCSLKEIILQLAEICGTLHYNFKIKFCFQKDRTKKSKLKKLDRCNLLLGDKDSDGELIGTEVSSVERDNENQFSITPWLCIAGRP
jgi:hypothetical protein